MTGSSAAWAGGATLDLASTVELAVDGLSGTEALAGERQQHLEAGAAVDRLQAQVAAVPHDDPPGDVEPEAGALTRLLRREERVEDALCDLRRDARAVVLDLHADEVARAATSGS